MTKLGPLGLALASILFLSGCAADVNADAIEDIAAEQPIETVAPEQAEVAEPEAMSADIAREIMLASYAKFESLGMTETVVSEGETWRLVYDPEQTDYQAALFNETTGDRELIFETDYFTLFVGYLMIETEGFDITPTERGFIIGAPEYNPIEYIVEGDLVVGAQGVEFDWVAQFDYSVDPELRIGLEDLARELIESFD